MFFSMAELRPAIIRLFEQGKSGRKIAESLNIPARTAQAVIKRFKETGSYNDKARSGRPRTARTPANKRKIKSRIQRNPSNRKNSTRKLGKAIGISHETVRTGIVSRFSNKKGVPMGQKNIWTAALGFPTRRSTITQVRRNAESDSQQRAGFHRSRHKPSKKQW